VDYKKYLKESTIAGAYAETGPKAMAGDDDYPTGNILIGDKFKKTDYYNRLTSFNINWVIDDSDWNWFDAFPATAGMETMQSYHDTLKDYFLTDRLFGKHMNNKPAKDVPKDLRPLGGELGPYSGDSDKTANTDVWYTEDGPDVPNESLKEKMEKYLEK
jgi:hypothetical protein